MNRRSRNKSYTLHNHQQITRLSKIQQYSSQVKFQLSPSINPESPRE